MNEHKTHSSWAIWYHNPSDNNWNLKSYKNVFEFDSLESYFKFLNTWKNNLPNLDSSMFFIMRKKDKYEYIYPMWEDKNNKPGGCWSFKVDNKKIDELWKILTFYLVGENICISSNISSKINGLSFSPKKGFCIVKIWNDDSNNSSKNQLNPTLEKYMKINSCLYKSHVENISKDLQKKKRIKNKWKKSYWNR